METTTTSTEIVKELLKVAERFNGQLELDDQAWLCNYEEYQLLFGILDGDAETLEVESFTFVYHHDEVWLLELTEEQEGIVKEFVNSEVKDITDELLNLAYQEREAKEESQDPYKYNGVSRADFF